MYIYIFLLLQKRIKELEGSQAVLVKSASVQRAAMERGEAVVSELQSRLEQAAAEEQRLHVLILVKGCLDVLLKSSGDLSKFVSDL